MTVLMLLQGGPLDGEMQIVQVLPTDPGSTLVFNIPNFQTFDPNTEDEVVIGLGLMTSYSLIEQGPDPDPDVGDTWDTSWIFGFTGQAYIPTPPDLPVPPNPDITGNQVAMFSFSNLGVFGTRISGAQFVAESAMDVQGATTPVEAGHVSMQAVTVLQAVGGSSFGFGMHATSGMVVTAS